MTRPIRLLLVDDHALLRESLGQRFDAEADLQVVGSVATADRALEVAASLKPDMAIVDIDMPGMICFDAADRLRRMQPGIRIVYLSAFWHDGYIEQAIATHANGYLTKNEQLDDVIDAIRAIAVGEIVYSPEIRKRLALRSVPGKDGAASSTPLSQLTPRESQVLRYIAQGLSKKDIGKTMHISDKTVGAHTNNLMRKLDIHDRVELTRFAIREGLVNA